ncbi:hypothetical protein HOLleu_40909 [Holothuria leucospilota]|uniref:Helix-turn-helix domain-containing protein n=1 Tax=Holothuria leucospilota TaxID=206669 RepID=A0A9Q0YFS4_HOLLE|nr:hypothetical protein HOLleu_40909 [Holothuria leucospilota]
MYKSPKGTIDLKPNSIQSQLTPTPIFYPHPQCHPKHTFTCIPYSQALRVIRNCSEENTSHHLSELNKQFIRRGYSSHVVKEQIHNAQQLSRDDLLTYKQKENNTRVPLVITYSPILYSI